MTTARKPMVDANPVQWAKNGVPLNLYEESQEPFNAKALKRRREAVEARGNGDDKPDEGAKVKFTKLDFHALVIAENLETPAAVMAYVQDKASLAAQAYIARSQRRLPELLEEAHAWGAARAEAAIERESDWALLQRFANGRCACVGGSCLWMRAATSFFARNRATLDGERLAASLAKVIREGPGKNTRVPLLAGPTNTAKSTILLPLGEVFGHRKVMNTPALGSTMPLVTLVAGKVRFLLWDEFNPVEFAAYPLQKPTIPVLTFLKLFTGQWFEVQVSQCFHNGNKEFNFRGKHLTLIAGMCAWKLYCKTSSSMQAICNPFPLGRAVAPGSGLDVRARGPLGFAGERHRREHPAYERPRRALRGLG